MKTEKSVNCEAVTGISLTTKSLECTRVLEINNALSIEDLEYDEDYRETMEEIKDECVQYGTLKNMCMPRTGVHATKIFLEYASVEDAEKAFNELRMKTFDGKVVTVDFVTMDCQHFCCAN